MEQQSKPRKKYKQQEDRLMKQLAFEEKRKQRLIRKSMSADPDLLKG